MRSKNGNGTEILDYVLATVFVLVIGLSFTSLVTYDRPLWHWILSIIVAFGLIMTTMFGLFHPKAQDELVLKISGLIGLILLEIHIGANAVIYILIDKTVGVFYIEFAMYLWVLYLISKRVVSIKKIRQQRRKDGI